MVLRTILILKKKKDESFSPEHCITLPLYLTFCRKKQRDKITFWQKQSSDNYQLRKKVVGG
jgi:hypothetical protein